MKLQTKQKGISKFYIFIGAITCLKIMLSGCFSSDYQIKLFLPFVSYFVEHLENPYQVFYERGIINAFPYPAIMLLIESFGVLIIKIFNVTSVFGQNLCFKLPSLLFDFWGLYLLVKLFPEKRRYAAVLYFASPIILYAVYMHGQLDIIPTIFLFAAAYYLVSRKKNGYLYSGIFLTLALLSKFHVFVTLPIIFMFLYKRDGVKKTIIFCMGVMSAVILGMLPMMSKGFCEMVLLNSEQSILMQVSLRLATIDIYIPIMAVLLLYLLAYNINIMNKELFFGFLGIVFAVILILCPPMPGWYVWVIPYVMIFFASITEKRYKNILVYMLLNIFYLSYFLLFHQRDMVDLYFLHTDMSFFKIDNIEMRNLMLTLLTSVLTYITLVMYQLGVASNSFYRRRNLPFTIGVTGDSGTGKSTFIQIVSAGLGEKNLLFIEGDGDHKWERGEKHWQEFTHLNPRANYLYRQASDLRTLRMGANVNRVEYDHDTGKFTTPRKIKPKRFVMLCGLHSLWLPQTRQNLDLKIYMDVDETLRRYWKIQRDMAYRGYTKEKIMKQIEDRMPDADKYIHLQKEYADIIISYYDKTLVDYMEDNHTVKMSVKITVGVEVNIEPLIDEMIQYGLNVSYDYSEDLKMQIVDIDAEEFEKTLLPVEKIANRIIPQLDEITRENLDGLDNREGVLKLFLLLLVSYKMRGE